MGIFEKHNPTCWKCENYILAYNISSLLYKVCCRRCCRPKGAPKATASSLLLDLWISALLLGCRCNPSWMPSEKQKIISSASCHPTCVSYAHSVLLWPASFSSPGVSPILASAGTIVTSTSKLHFLHPSQGRSLMLTSTGTVVPLTCFLQKFSWNWDKKTLHFLHHACLSEPCQCFQCMPGACWIVHQDGIALHQIQHHRAKQQNKSKWHKAIDSQLNLSWYIKLWMNKITSKTSVFVI